MAVAQEFVHRTLLFNNYINHLFFLTESTNMCNYADDITFHACELNLKCLVKKLEHDSMLASGWSVSNNIPLNENKCRFLLSRCRHEMSLLNRVPSVPTCQRGLRANVPINVPTCHTACQCFKLACQRVKRRANFSNIPLTKCYGKFLYFIIKKNYTLYLIL